MPKPRPDPFSAPQGSEAQHPAYDVAPCAAPGCLFVVSRCGAHWRWDDGDHVRGPCCCASCLDRAPSRRVSDSTDVE